MGASSAYQKLLAFPIGYLKRSQKTCSDAFTMDT